VRRHNPSTGVGGRSLGKPTCCLVRRHQYRSRWISLVLAASLCPGSRPKSVPQFFCFWVLGVSEVRLASYGPTTDAKHHESRYRQSLDCREPTPRPPGRLSQASFPPSGKGLWLSTASVILGLKSEGRRKILGPSGFRCFDHRTASPGIGGFWGTPLFGSILIPFARSFSFRL
jgi:hypothetical protein